MPSRRVFRADLLLLISAGALFSALLVVIVLVGTGRGIDAAATRWADAHRRPGLTTAMRVFTALGSSAVLVPVVAGAGVTLRLRRLTWTPLVFLAATFGLAVAVYDLAKPLVGRSRPALVQMVATATGFAFPSGHATQSTAVYAALVVVAVPAAWSRPRRAAAWAVAGTIAFFVGLSRIYLGVHWLSDVVAGWALGTFCVTAVTMAARTRVSG